MSREMNCKEHKKNSPSLLHKLAEEQGAATMAEGYKAIAGEQKQLAAMASKIEHEVLPQCE